MFLVKVFEKIANNRIVYHLEKSGLFSDFQYGFKSFRSNADLLTVAADRIARAYNRPSATQAVALDMVKTFDRVSHAGLLHKPRSYRLIGHIFGLISFFLNNRRLRVLLNGKSLYVYSVSAGAPERSILGPKFFLVYIKDLLDNDDVFCDIAICVDDTTLYSKYDPVSYL